MPFLSIFLFVGMSITLYAGLTWTGRALQDRVEEALDQGNANDYTVISELGITDSDISQLSELPEISEVEAAYLSYQKINGEEAGSADREVYCSVNSIPEQISTLEVDEGVLPSKSNEIALLRNCVQYLNYKVGDTVSFDPDGDDPSANEGMQCLTNRTFTITAIVDSPDYLCDSRLSLGIDSQGNQITCVFFASKNAFVPDAYDNSYPLVYLTGKGLRGINSFNDAYTTASDSILSTISLTGETLAQKRYESLKAAAEQKIADGQRQLDEAKAKIDDAEAQISDGEEQLASKKSELADARDMRAQLEQERSEGSGEVAYYSNMSDSLQGLSESVVNRFRTLGLNAYAHASDPELDSWFEQQCSEVNAETSAEVNAFKSAFSTRPSEVDALLDGLALDANSLETCKKAAENAIGLSVAADTIRSDVVQPGQEKLNEADSAIGQLNTAIEEGEVKIVEAENQLYDAQVELANKKAQYDNGVTALEAAKVKAQEIRPSKWIITDRNDSYVDQLARTTSQTLYNLRLTMALLFIIVGLLVCYSVMSRLVHEHLAQLGTKKALGFTTFEISKLFLCFALLACLLGILLGATVGAPITQLVLIPSMNQYMFTPPGIVFNISDIVGVSSVQIVLICLSAWLACRSILKENAIELLRGDRPSSAKRRFYEGWACWKRMGMLTQTMINNSFNDKRRMFGTLVGVAGCTSLIVCAMTLQTGIKTTTDEQEDVIERYDQVVYVTENVSGASSATGASANGNANAQTVDEIIASRNYTSVKACYDSESIKLPDGTRTFVSLICPEDMDHLSDVVTVKQTLGSASSSDTLSDDDVYVSKALADYYHFKIGDRLDFDDSDGGDHDATITGIFNYFSGVHVVIMGKNAYVDCFDVQPHYTARMVASGDDADAFSNLVKSAVDLDQIFDSRELTRQISDMVNNLALTVVAIYVGISALVALSVLLNLNFMYVAEKKRELVVMMVNGYEVKDAKRYVSRDTIIMNAFGMLIGCLLGTGMGILAIHSLQNDRLTFIANPSLFAWLVGVVVCALFSAIVMRIALHRVGKFKLTSVNE